MEGEFVDIVIGILGSRSHIVMLRPPDGGPGLELSRFVRPEHEPGSPTAMANELGLRNVSFEVDDLQADGRPAGCGRLRPGRRHRSVREHLAHGLRARARGDHRFPGRADRLTRPRGHTGGRRLGDQLGSISPHDRTRSDARDQLGRECAHLLSRRDASLAPIGRALRNARNARNATAGAPRGSSMRPLLATRANPASSEAAAPPSALSLPVSDIRSHANAEGGKCVCQHKGRARGARSERPRIRHIRASRR